jgi:hypothetical protein
LGDPLNTSECTAKAFVAKFAKLKDNLFLLELEEVMISFKGAHLLIAVEKFRCSFCYKTGEISTPFSIKV